MKTAEFYFPGLPRSVSRKSGALLRGLPLTGRKTSLDIGSIKARCVEIIKSHLPESRWHVCLFGSQAKGSAGDSSDIDIAIVGDEPVPCNIMTTVRSEISDMPTLRSVDVVDICSTDDRFRDEILQYGEMLA